MLLFLSFFSLFSLFFLSLPLFSLKTGLKLDEEMKLKIKKKIKEKKERVAFTGFPFFAFWIKRINVVK